MHLRLLARIADPRYRATPRLSLALTVLLGTSCILDYQNPPIGPQCGNGVIEYPEECDDGDSAAGDGCSSECEVEPAWACDGYPSVCNNTCGNGVADNAEACDGSDLAGETCETQAGLGSGELRCSADCLAYDSTGCYSCGDGLLQGPERCDGAEFAGETCATQSGFESGELSCNYDCLSVNISACSTCGDGQIHGQEECDGANLNAMDCRDFPLFNSGTLACGADCRLDTTGCSTSCDTIGDCYACSLCARETTCDALTAACYANNDCGLILHYIDNECDPPDYACQQFYVDWFPAGLTEFNNLATCLYCNACVVDCAGQGFCGN